MNVSIQRVIEDLDTKVATMQLAIATYALATAALMLFGGKLAADGALNWPKNPRVPARLRQICDRAKERARQDSNL